jgi:2-polyprenyl-6-methoxyphenol hydroxylase-like FAD-dependent oxidoreductase
VEVRARLVLAADGLGGGLLTRAGIPSTSKPASRIGAGVILDTAEEVEPFYAPGVIWMACGRSGYVGLTRLEDGRLDVACALDTQAVRLVGGPGPVAVEVLRSVGWPLPGKLDDLPWRGTPPLTRQAQLVAHDRLFALGDATGYVEPFTGEGMAWALSSAVALAPLARRAAREWQPGLMAEWTHLHRRIVTRRQSLCRMTAAVLRRPWLTKLVVALLSWLPGLARPVVAHLNHHPSSIFPGGPP